MGWLKLYYKDKEGIIMLSLFIDTHSDQIIFALYKNEKLLSKTIIEEKKNHSAICMPELIKFLEDQKTEVEDITDIIVVNGPGSFTGVRIGVTIAKTLAYTLNIPIRTLTSLETLIYGFKEDIVAAMEEKNGYYLGTWYKNEKKVDHYEYLNKKEFETIKSEKKIIEPTEIEFENLSKFAHEKEVTNPHAVNPLYIKKIGVEK